MRVFIFEHMAHHTKLYKLTIVSEHEHLHDTTFAIFKLRTWAAQSATNLGTAQYQDCFGLIVIEVK